MKRFLVIAWLVTTLLWVAALGAYVVVSLRPPEGLEYREW